MRIILDLQAAQTGSRFRGIGRYAIDFALAITKNRGDHEVYVILSEQLPDSILDIREAFAGILPDEFIRVWSGPSPVSWAIAENRNRRELSEALLGLFYQDLNPNIVHFANQFEGYGDNAITGLAGFSSSSLVSISIADLIPLVSSDTYFHNNQSYKDFYFHKLDNLKKADVFLTISEYSRLEAIENLKIDSDSITNASLAIDPIFQPIKIKTKIAQSIFSRYLIKSDFILYVGAVDSRKNISKLILAYAQLPASICASLQLVIAGKIAQPEIDIIHSLAKESGIHLDKLVFTGYVSDEELVFLYNLCKLFVMPSWHEGFGLPVLEAMSCGAPVICSNTSSLPEVIGIEDALFDPFDEFSIAQKIIQVLSDPQLSLKIKNHALHQVQKFTWDNSATTAIEAWERSYSRFLEQGASSLDIDHFSLITQKALSLDIEILTSVSDSLVLNKFNGIRRQIFLDVSELCQRDAGTGVQRVVRSYLRNLLENPPKDYVVEPVYATLNGDYKYARKFTSEFQGIDSKLAIDSPIEWQRGDVFFGLDMQHHVQLAHKDFFQSLVYCGVIVKFMVYDLLPIRFPDLFVDSEAKDLHESWLSMIAMTDGAICISAAVESSYWEWIDERKIKTFPTFHLSHVHIGANFESAEAPIDDSNELLKSIAALDKGMTFLSVSTIEPRKCHEQILNAFEILWEDGFDLNLVFVGRQGWNMNALCERISTHPKLNTNLFWFGSGVSDSILEKIYKKSSCLISASLDEGFGLPLIEAARHGLPIIARDIAVFREVACQQAFYFSGAEPASLASAILEWRSLFLNDSHPRSHEMQWSTWSQSTQKLQDALLVNNHRRMQLFLDVSELVEHDKHTGIQRVVRALLLEWYNSPPDGFRVELVYADKSGGYKYARQFTLEFFNLPHIKLADEPIQYTSGDVFIGLDLVPSLGLTHEPFFQKLRRYGVLVKFHIHDILCLQMPQYFPEGAYQDFSSWLAMVARADGAVCVSKAVADDVACYFKKHNIALSKGFDLSWSHNGSDLENTQSTIGISPKDIDLINTLADKTTFLMVGTLEPRKGHAQVLEAMDILWNLQKHEINLIIIGKCGWHCDDLAKKIRSHPMFNECLHWMEDASDEFLGELYGVSDCLIAASYGEGFGLPLVEAAAHRLPIIARDIPVFREVAGAHAFYFDSLTGQGLANKLIEWRSLRSANSEPSSDGITCITWAQSARTSLALFLRRLL